MTNYQAAAAFRVAEAPADGYSLWFLGQNSFLLKTPGGARIAIDPYLSDWCASRGQAAAGAGRSRLFPPPFSGEDLEADYILISHSHCDHADPETLSGIAKRFQLIDQATQSPPILIGPYQTMEVARQAGWPASQIRLVHPNEELTLQPDLKLRITFALPTDGGDLNHIGFLLCLDNGSSFYNTGDTAWCDILTELIGPAIREALPPSAAGPDLMAVCINAGYGNLSHWQASRLVGALKARFAIPSHWDLFPHNRCDPEPFRTSLAKNAPNSLYSLLEVARRYDFSGGQLRPYNS